MATGGAAARPETMIMLPRTSHHGGGRLLRARVYFSVVGGTSYRGTARSPQDTVNATPLIKAGHHVSPNVALKAPVAGRDGERRPNRLQRKSYTGGIRGVRQASILVSQSDADEPKFDPFMRIRLRGQPDGPRNKRRLMWAAMGAAI